jgi:lipopolysaccharide biosynthesis glycosyltransferase
MNKKIAFTTVLDDKYIKGFFITLNSILIASENFNYDVVILDWGDLSNFNKNQIKNFYKNVKFKKVNKSKYENFKYDNTYRTWQYNCNYRFDIFLMEEYDRIVFFDCDIIFQLDCEEILKYDVDFGACAAIENSISQINSNIGFVAGLMSIGKKYINQKTFDSLMEIAYKDPLPDKTKFNTNLWVSDEPILNNYFLDKITWLPNEFNMILAKTKYEEIHKKINYHFCGNNKPWFSGGVKEKFSKYVFQCLLHTSKSQVKVDLILKKMINLCNIQIENLKLKDIYIEDLKDIIKPSHIE